MANSKNSTSKITKVQIRMYRVGTGDFFMLLFKKGDKVSFKMMIDCGCIYSSKDDFLLKLDDLDLLITNKVIDLLVVTHEHADHINGFEKCSDLFDKYSFKKVWFAWTEDDKDPIANDYRANYSKLGLGINKATEELKGLNDYYKILYSNEVGGDFMLKGKQQFIQSLTSLDDLIPMKGLAINQPLPTMVELLKNYKIIKDDTVVKYLEPGNVVDDLLGAEGIRFYILGPPRNRVFLNKTEAEEETFEKREKKSTIDFSFLSAIGATDTYGSAATLPFESEFEAAPDNKGIQKVYKEGGEWRKIDYDWLYSAGALAMRYERSINNTSLALAIQFEDSERILLFTGDAEIGNWESWYKDLEWPVKINGRIVQKKADYFLNNTIFYKVGHHLSQNGTAKGKGIEMMNNTDLTSMASLDFKKISTVWLKTMPNDLLGAELIRKTKGKLLFAGNHEEILKNIKTDRVTISQEHLQTLNDLNGKFKGEVYIDWVVEG